MNFFKSFFIQGKERPAKKKLFPAKLRAVLVTFGSFENEFADSAQKIVDIFAKYHHIPPKFPGNGDFQKN